MNKIIYVFNEELAGKLSSVGHNMFSEVKKEDGSGYKLFTMEEIIDPAILLNFKIGTDYIFTNKIFFKEGTNE